LALGAFAAVDALSLPGASPGVGLDAALLLRPFRVDLAGVAFLPRRATDGPARADVSLSAVALRAGWGFTFARFELRPNLVAEGGVVHATSAGVSEPGDGDGRWWAVGAGAAFGVGLGRRVSVTFGIDALGLLIRDEFTIRGRGPIYRPPPVTVRASLGAEWRLW
jgi:hypothetical protein